MAVAVVYAPACLHHDPGAGHPERPERLRVLVEALRADSVLQGVSWIEPKPASIEDLRLVHTREHIERVRTAVARAPALLDGGDTIVGTASFEAALYAAGAVIEAIDLVMARQARSAFCPVRPPGHHATADRAMGFCLFNNVAIGARHLLSRHGLERVLIVDWDVHHGNGTQEIFYEDPRVLYFSVHQYPFYPGESGAADRTGTGAGEGFNVNVPLAAGSTDEVVLAAVRDRLLPAVERFRPQFVLISCGFDAHRDDLLGGLGLSTEAFGELTRLMVGIAERFCEARLVSVLEGGYTLAALASTSRAWETSSKAGPIQAERQAWSSAGTGTSGFAVTFGYRRGIPPTTAWPSEAESKGSRS